MDNFQPFLALNRINGVGPRTVLKFLEKWPNLSDMFKLSSSQLEEHGVNAKVAYLIANFKRQEIKSDLLWQENPAHNILTWQDKKYPSLLREIHDPPIVLYLRGDITCLKKASLAIVGTRKPSITGRENARRFAYHLAERNINIVSGLALGVDTEAHTGSLSASGSTIAVMGTGIDCIYPRRNHELAQRICEKGLLISEFPLKTSANAGHFPRRNRIISGLSSATLVVEAAIRSGSLITARFALEHNRDVLAIPGSIHNPQARGCHKLLQQGAKLVTSIEDILEEMNLYSHPFEKVVPNDTLTCENKKLVKYIGFEITIVDQMVQRSGMTVGDIMSDLAELELKGIVKAVPGGYMRCK
ncbi:MAG: DNA-processing protein DprA [Legionellaceae bacterium]|nr:DNA-processing protein DprA [Legionellaceae bacterium]